jgi:hypothetical protein
MVAVVGIRPFTGWAVALSLEVGPEGPRVVDRRRLRLIPPEWPVEFYHTAAGLEPDAGSKLIAAALEASIEEAAANMRELVRDLGSPVRIALVAGKRPPSAPPEHGTQAHVGMHAAEGQAYRYGLLCGAEAAGVEVPIVTDDDLSMAAGSLGLADVEVRARLAAMGAAIGPPWTQREKSAALAAWLVMART